MILLLGFYEDADPASSAEYVECLRRNCANPCIDQVVAFIEDGHAAGALRKRWTEFNHPKLELVEHRSGRRQHGTDGRAAAA